VALRGSKVTTIAVPGITVDNLETVCSPFPPFHYFEWGTSVQRSKSRKLSNNVTTKLGLLDDSYLHPLQSLFAQNP
jgi:hypothetical protein